MKLKDVENKLKREQEGAPVPDVYARASKAPLNKLLTGETPAKAFQRQTVTALLAAVLVIFLVIAIGLSAMWLSPKAAPTGADCYVCVVVQREEGASRIGLIMDGKNVSVAVVEQTDGVVNTSPVKSHTSRISDLIEAKAGDKVSVEILYSNSSVLSDSVRTTVDELELLYYGKAFEMKTLSNSADTRVRTKEYISLCGGQVEDGATAEDLIKAYLSLFA